MAKDVRRLQRAFGMALSLQWRAARREMVLVIATQTLDAALLAVQLVFVHNLLDLLSRSDRASFAAFWPTIAGITACYVARSVSRPFVSEQQWVMSELVQRDIIGRVLAAASRADVEDFEDPAFHDRLNRVRNETYQNTWTLVWSFVNLASQVLVSVSMVVVLASIAPAVLLIGVLGLFPFVWSNRRRNRLLYGLTIEQTAPLREREYLENLLTTRASVPELRSLALGDHLVGRVRALHDRRVAATRNVARRRFTVTLASSLVSSVLAGAALAMLVAVAVNGDLGVASAGVAVLALQQVTGQLRGVVDVFGELDAAAPFLEDFDRFEREDLPRLLASAEHTEMPLLPLESLAFDGVSFTYPGTEHEVLHDLSVTIGAGEVVALVGENGSGKTTLAKLVAGLYGPTSGRIMWNATDRSTLDRTAVRRSVALVFQDFGCYELTAHENVAFGDVTRLGDADGVRSASVRSGADEFLSELPKGYETLLSRSFEEGVELSGGQWQRVAIARAFFRDAPILVLDEPTAALDPLAEHELFERLRSLTSGRTVILISHRFSTVRSADRILVLDSGQLIEEGSHGELMALGGHYARMFTVQATPYAS